MSTAKVKFSIRVANEQDIAAILKLYDQPDMTAGETMSLEQAVAIYRKTQQYPDYKFYVAETENNVIMGSFGLLIMDRLDHAGDTSGVLTGVVVHPDYHRQGIGKQLMQYAMQKCCEANCYKMILSSNIKRVEAHEFYRALGFKEHGLSFLVECC